MRHAQAASDADSAMQASSTQGRTVALTRFRSKQPPAAHSSSNTAGQADLMEQPSQAPQDSTDSEPTQPIRRRHRGSAKQLCMSSLGNPAAALHSGAAGQDQCEAIGRSPSTCTTNMSHQAPPGFASPASDGRTVVVTGFNKGLAGPEARQRAVDLCSQHGETTACWLRKGKSSCWFIIVQYTEVSHQPHTLQGLAFDCKATRGMGCTLMMCSLALLGFVNAVNFGFSCVKFYSRG